MCVFNFFSAVHSNKFECRRINPSDAFRNGAWKAWKLPMNFNHSDTTAGYTNEKKNCNFVDIRPFLHELPSHMLLFFSLSLALWQVFALSLVILCALFGNSTLVFHFRKQSIHLYKSHSSSFTICQYSPDVVTWSGFMIVKSLWNRLECDCFYCIMIHFSGAVNNCLYLQPQNLVFICAVFYSCLMHTSIQTSIACITNSWY